MATCLQSQARPPDHLLGFGCHPLSLNRQKLQSPLPGCLQRPCRVSLLRSSPPWSWQQGLWCPAWPASPPHPRPWFSLSSRSPQYTTACSFPARVGHFTSVSWSSLPSEPPPSALRTPPQGSPCGSSRFSAPGRVPPPSEPRVSGAGLPTVTLDGVVHCSTSPGRRHTPAHPGIFKSSWY